MPACAIENVRPAIVSAPWRAATAEFAATVKFTCPGPVPLFGEPTDIQSALAAAVHAQPPDTETDTVPVPPSAPNACDVGLIDGLHCGAGGGAGDAPVEPIDVWLIVIVWPATRTVPVRDAPPLAATFRVTAPLPVPFAPSLTAIQSVWLAAVHPQVPADCTFTATDPPCAGTVVLGAVTSYRQAASCVIATCVLLTSIVPRRCAESVFAAIRYAADPSP